MFRKLGRTALTIATLALLAALAPGCNLECIDKFDCITKAKRQADGGLQELTCDNNNKCVAGNPNAAPAGCDAGVDGGGC